jgi:hypothetical protein
MSQSRSSWEGLKEVLKTELLHLPGVELTRQNFSSRAMQLPSGKTSDLTTLHELAVSYLRS